MSFINIENLKEYLGEVGFYLKQVVMVVGGVIKGVIGVVIDELWIGKVNVKVELFDSVLFGLVVVEFGGVVVKEQVDVLMDKGKDLIDSVVELICECLLVLFGVVFVVGWIIVKLVRGSGDK